MRVQAERIARMREMVASQREILARTRPKNLAPPPKWYRIQNVAPTASTGARAEIFIYSDISWWGVTAEDFVDELTALSVDAIDVRINSPGGDVWDGVAIYNALRAHRAEVTTYVDGLAASAASVIMMAGTRRVARRGTRMMIHDASSLVYGNPAYLREYADLLEAIGEDIARTYLAAAGGTLQGWQEAMRAETWYSAPEAVQVGLATETEADTDSPADADSPDTSVVAGGDDDDDDPLARWVGSLASVVSDPALAADPVPVAGINAHQWDADAIRAILRGETVA